MDKAEYLEWVLAQIKSWIEDYKEENIQDNGFEADMLIDRIYKGIGRAEKSCESFTPCSSTDKSG